MPLQFLRISVGKKTGKVCSPAWGASAPRKDENGFGGLCGREAVFLWRLN